MTNQQIILDRIKSIVLDKDTLAKVYLYGSRARGTMKSDSDWDLLILLNIRVNTPEKQMNFL